jgi:hypothetical protein
LKKANLAFFPVPAAAGVVVGKVLGGILKERIVSSFIQISCSQPWIFLRICEYPEYFKTKTT